MREVVFDGSLDAVEIRQIYTQIMEELLEKDIRVVIGDADVGFSVYGGRMGSLAKKFGDRFFDVGIQEGNLVGMAAGLSLVGKIPYLALFAPFISRRVYDTVYSSLAYARLGAKLIGCDPGYTSSYNGGSHSALEDVGIMRCLPNIRIVDISDSVMLRWVLEENSDPSALWYIRTPRSVKLEKIYAPGTSFRCGEAKVLREGGDVTLFASGLMVAKALKAAELLEKEGISVRVVDAVSVKPLDKDCLVRCAKETGAIVCCDNHREIGGLCSAAAEALAEAGASCVFEKVAICDRFGEVGSAEYLSTVYKLNVEDICEKTHLALERKNK